MLDIMGRGSRERRYVMALSYCLVTVRALTETGGIRTDHHAIQRYSSYVFRLSKKCPWSLNE